MSRRQASTLDGTQPLVDQHYLIQDETYILPTDKQGAGNEEKKKVDFEARNLEKLRAMQERKDKELKQMEDERAKVLRR